MSILSLASAQSVYRGYEYYKAEKVIDLCPDGENRYRGTVSGSNGQVYQVAIDLEHPRRGSSCTCPHAAGRNIVCKHMVALYFFLFPEEARQYIDELEAYWAEEEQRCEEAEQALIRCVGQMKKKELQQALLQLLLDGPEWQYKRFLRDYEIW